MIVKLALCFIFPDRRFFPALSVASRAASIWRRSQPPFASSHFQLAIPPIFASFILLSVSFLSVLLSPAFPTCIFDLARVLIVLQYVFSWQLIRPPSFVSCRFHLVPFSAPILSSCDQPPPFVVLLFPAAIEYYFHF